MEPDKKNDSKFFFKIGELVEITGIPSSKIRYWTKKYKELASQLRTNAVSYTHLTLPTILLV